MPTSRVDDAVTAPQPASPGGARGRSEPAAALDAAVYLTDRHGVRIVNENLSDAGETISGPPQRYRIQFILSPLLAAGDYVAGVWLGTLDDLVFDGDLLGLTILPLPRDRGESVHGAVRPSVRWSVSTERSAP